MYTSSATRIYNPRPDPAELGPPKRVNREETHIGEMIATSKKRISWKFTLGESDMPHEVVLVHSIMSYKKVIEFDGRQMHYSATFTPGDWKFLMILDGSNHVFEVRINDLESADVPKYDLAVERIPFRHWDVYTRRKQPITTATYAQPYAAQQQPSTFGTQRWGPNGMSAPPPPPQEQLASNARYNYSSGAYAHDSSSTRTNTRERRSSSFNAQQQQRDSGGSRGSFTGAPQQQRDSGGNRSSFTGQLNGPQAPQAHNARSPPVPRAAAAAKKQPEINLIDDFGPSVSVPAQSLLFDPLAGSAFAAQQQPQAQANAATAAARTASSPAFAPPFHAQQQQPPPSNGAAPFVAPFAHAPPAAPLHPPTATPMSLSQFAATPSTAFPQQQQQQQQSTQQSSHLFAPSQQPLATYHQQQHPSTIPMQQRNGTPVMPMAMPYQQQPHQHVTPAMPVVQPVAHTAGSINYNISQLMNPVDVHGRTQQTQQPTKAINIDAFAGMS